MAKSAAKPRRGRPPKDDSAKLNQSIYVRADQETLDAIHAFQKQDDCATESEAVRRLVRRALKAEGLL